MSLLRWFAELDERGKARLWFWSLIVLVAANILLGLRFILDTEPMWIGMQNHDTRVIVWKLENDHDYVKYLTGDWALGNHFYRPIPTYSFLLDLKLWGQNLYAYKWLNVVVCSLCAGLVAVFLKDWLRSRKVALCAAIFFTAWQTDALVHVPVQQAVTIMGLGILVGAGIFDRKRWGQWALIGLTLVYLANEFVFAVGPDDHELRSFGFRTMGWPPGRTAVLFVFFALLALITGVRAARSRKLGWALACSGSVILAFMTYEQALIMAPAFGFVLLVMSLRGERVPWWWLTAPVAITVCYYLLWRHAFAAPSPYQTERLRRYSVGFSSLLDLLLPCISNTAAITSAITSGIFALLTPGFFGAVLSFVANGAAVSFLRRIWLPALAGLVGSAIVFGQMAFVIPLEHYLYFASVFRALFVAVMILAVGQEILRLLASHAGFGNVEMHEVTMLRIN